MSLIGNRSSAGFTLVEVMLSITILAVGIAGVLGAYSVLLSGLEASESTLEAALIFNVKLPEIEEKCISEGSVPAGRQSGMIKEMGRDYAWAQESKSFNAGIKLNREKLRDLLTQVDITLSDESRRSAGIFSLSTYMENQIEQ